MFPEKVIPKFFRTVSIWSKFWIHHSLYYITTLFHTCSQLKLTLSLQDSTKGTQSLHTPLYEWRANQTWRSASGLHLPLRWLCLTPLHGPAASVNTDTRQYHGNTGWEPLCSWTGDEDSSSCHSQTSGEHVVVVFCIAKRPELTLSYSWALGGASHIKNIILYQLTSMHFI